MWSSLEELEFQWGTWNIVVLLATLSLLGQRMQRAAASTCCVFSHWWLHSPWCSLTFNSSNELLLSRFLTLQIAVWLGFGTARRTSSGRECTGHSDTCVAGRLQAVDSYFDVLGLHIGLVSLLSEVHRLRDGLCTVCQEQWGSKPGEGPSSRTIDDLQSGPPASGILYFHTVECPSLFLF